MWGPWGAGVYGSLPQGINRNSTQQGINRNNRNIHRNSTRNRNSSNSTLFFNFKSLGVLGARGDETVFRPFLGLGGRIWTNLDEFRPIWTDFVQFRRPKGTPRP